jgi:hypothetical protein
MGAVMDKLDRLVYVVVGAIAFGMLMIGLWGLAAIVWMAAHW